MHEAKAAGTYTPSEKTIAIVTELLKSADRLDRAVGQAEARAEQLMAQPADPFDGLDLDAQWALS
jgi:hypothetical protein